MDRLEEMYELQRKFEEMFFTQSDFLSNVQTDLGLNLKWNKEFVLALLKESSEILDNLSWKTHVEKDKKLIRDNLLRIVLTLLNTCLL